MVLARILTEAVAALDNFISINNAVDIDLFGQVSSESSGTKQISGAGGQLDFVMGAYQSRGGKSFICLSSTFMNKNGELQSRILPTLWFYCYRYPCQYTLRCYRIRQG